MVKKPPPKPTRLPTVALWPDVADRVRDAAAATGLTVTALVAGAIDREIGRLANERNGGRAFPKRRAPLRRGRRKGATGPEVAASKERRR